MRFPEHDEEEQRKRAANRCARQLGKELPAVVAARQKKKILEQRAVDLANAIRNGDFNNLKDALIRHGVVR